MNIVCVCAYRMYANSAHMHGRVFVYVIDETSYLVSVVNFDFIVARNAQ